MNCLLSSSWDRDAVLLRLACQLDVQTKIANKRFKRILAAKLRSEEDNSSATGTCEIGVSRVNSDTNLEVLKDDRGHGSKAVDQSKAGEEIGDSSSLRTLDAIDTVSGGQETTADKDERDSLVSQAMSRATARGSPKYSNSDAGLTDQSRANKTAEDQGANLLRVDDGL